MIPLFKPEFGKEELTQIKDVLDSGILAYGKKSRELEEKFAEYVGCKHAIGVNSCTSALFLAYTTLNKNALVFIPDITFVSVVNMAVHAGLHVEFNDKMTVGFAYRIGNTRIWDFAHELYRGCFKKVQPEIYKDSIACFSFYPTKNLGSAEGGMICTNDDKKADYFRKMRNHGMIRNGYDWDYRVEKAGWKMCINEIQSAIALAQLNKLDDMLEKRERVVGWYNDIFGTNVFGYHIYPILVDKRNDLMKEMREKEIGYTVNFKPVHRHPAYKHWHVKEHELKSSINWGRFEISLPLYPSLTKKEVEEVCKVVEPYR